jgi:hypothetical protein
LNFRTDLAIENKEMYDSDNGGKGIEISGVEVETENFQHIVDITRIKITDENGSKALQKPLETISQSRLQELWTVRRRSRRLLLWRCPMN